MSTRPLETIEDYRDRKAFMRFMGFLFVAGPIGTCLLFQVLQSSDLQAFTNKVASFFPLGR